MHIKRIIVLATLFAAYFFAQLEAQAQKPLAFHCAGSGFFTPANIGTPEGGTFGLVLGDGSGISSYVGSSNEFTIDGVPVGSGFNAHVGSVESRTTGIEVKGQNKVIWPGKSHTTHVLSSDDGEIYFQYTGAFTLDLLTGFFGADVVFVIKGGTGRFEGANGVVMVDVLVTGPPVEPIPFNYDFNGLIILKD